MRRRRTTIGFAMGVLAAMWVAGCADDGNSSSNNQRPVVPNTSSNGETNGDLSPDAGAPSGDTGGSGGDPSDPSNRGDASAGDSPDGSAAGEKCGEAVDQRFEFDPDVGQSVTTSKTVEFSAQTSDDITACTNRNGLDKVYAFEVASRSGQKTVAEANIEVSYDGNAATNIGYALYEGRCRNDSRKSRRCSGNNETVQLQTGTTYYLVLEIDEGVAEATFNLELDVERSGGECQTIGAKRCTNGSGGSARIENCSGDKTWSTYSCPTTCTSSKSDQYDSDFCRGTTCSTAIQVSRGRSEPYVVDWQPFLSLNNFSDYDSCGPEGSSEGLRTPGHEVVFQLPEMNRGETVEVEVDSACDVGLFILPECDSPDKDAKGRCTSGGSKKRCCASADDADPETPTEELTWTAQKQGRYYLYVDKRTSQLPPDNPEKADVDISFK